MKDANLRRCTHAEKGVWVDMLCLMFECDQRGVLATAGLAWSDSEIARAVGGELDLTAGCLQGLLAKGVAVRNQSGAVISRRMVRDEELRRDNAGRQAKWRNGANNAPRNMSLTRMSEDEDEDEDRDSGKGDARGKPEVSAEPSSLLALLGPIYKRDPSKHASFAEVSQAAEIVRRDGWREEAQLLLSYRGGLKSADCKYFPQSMASLLAKWDETLDRARMVQVVNGAEPEANQTQLYVLSRELDGVLEEMRLIKSGYEAHQNWTQDDVDKFKALRGRRDALKTQLGVPPQNATRINP
jgi:hypothetical protein